MSALFLLPMEVAHVPAVAQIEKVCFGPGWTPTQFQRELDNPRCVYFVALMHDTPVGYIGYWQILEEAHITSVAVLPDYRQRHVAQQLLLHMLQHCLEQNVAWITLEVKADNIPAQKLYEKFGFSIKGRRKNYYRDDRQDALIMWTDKISDSEYLSLLQKLKTEIPV
jgi:ribosomal-protein-alanine N-acetyltransferase